MNRVIRMVVAVLVLCAPAALAAPDKGEENFPLIEKYIRAGEVREFIADATAYVRANENSPYAPRVMFDLYMLATLRDDAKTADSAKAMLVFRYPESAYGMHLFKAFADAEAYRTFIIGRMDESLYSLGDREVKLLIGGIRRGMGRFGGKLLENNTFMLTCILLARRVGDVEMGQAIEKRFRDVLAADSEDKLADLAKVAAVCLAPDGTAADRVAKLDAMTDSAHADTFKQYFLSQLTPAERSTPAMTRIAAGVDVRAKRHDEALEKINSLPAKYVDAQVLYWKASSLFAKGETAKARKALAPVGGQPAGPWRTTCEKYAACLKDYDENLQANVATILAMMKRLREKTEVFECQVEVVDEESKRSFRLYIAAVFEENFLEIALFSQGKLLFIYKIDATGTRLYTRLDEEILHFRDRAVVPSFQSSLTRGPDGKFNLQMGVGITTSLKQSAQASERLWNSPFLTTRAGLLTFLGYGTRKNFGMPLSVEQVDGRTVLTWAGFGSDSPEVPQIEVHVNADNVLTDIRTDWLRFGKLYYGPKAGVKLSGPKWPDLKVRDVGKEDIPAIVGKLIGQAMKVLGELKE